MDLLAHCQAENARLRELYENVTGNRERFGWTINHLLECEEALRVAEEQLAGAVEAWNRAYWCWVHTGDAGDLSRLSGEDTWGHHPDHPRGQ